MKLPEDPTKEQMDEVCRTIIQSKYVEGVGAVVYRYSDGGGIEGRFRDARNAKRVFEFSIKGGQLSYSAISWAEEEDED